MNLLKRINNVLENSAQKKQNVYSSDSLKQISLNRNAFKTGFIFDDKNSPEYLAFNNPVQFVYKYLNAETLNKAIKLNPEISEFYQIINYL